MRIGIDARLWSGAGLGRYTKNIVINLSKIDTKNDYVIFTTKENESEIKNVVGKNFTIISFDARHHTLREQIEFPKVLKKENLDLIHFPYFSVPIFYRKPFVVTIHDLIYHHYATGEASTLPYWLFGFKMLSYRVVISTAINKSKKIITVSEFAKKDIIKLMHIDPEKIKVIYESADDFKKQNIQKTNKENYFLYVGNIFPHKNSEVLVKAFLDFSKGKNIKLIFVGKDDVFYRKFKHKYLKEIEKGKIEVLDKVDDEKLYNLYRNAVALVRPSLMEGFSLPPLEAIESEAPVLVSDIPVHREILGDAAIYFNPKDEMDLVSKMDYVLNLTTKQRELVLRKGKEKLKNFSWESTARKTLQVYESCVGVRQNQ